MRIVLDTNILARATPGRSGPAIEVLLRAIAAPHLLVLSLPLMSELSRVLRYEDRYFSREVHANYVPLINFRALA